MRITWDEDGTIDVYVRQSWVNDAIMCPERGRYGIVHPDESLPNDATILGTAVHAGIAHDLEETGVSRARMLEVAYQSLHDEMQKPMKWVKYNRTQLHNLVPELLDMYIADLRPDVMGHVARVEWGFKFMLDRFTIDRDLDVRVHGEGTVDLVVTNERVPLWDWKTAGRKFQVREKQEKSIQPTMYAAAAVAHGMATYPVGFNFGVMVRGGSAQIVTVTRNEGHVEWLRRQIRPFIRAAIEMGTDNTWPVNDTHYLCSDTWCPNWSHCKGAALASPVNPPTKKEAA